jgi:antitoxin CcdA
MQIKPSVEEKSPVNLRIRTSLKSRAKDLGVNLSRTLEKSLEAEISRLEQAAWLEANREAIDAYNERIEAHGPALSAYRSF